MENSIKKQLAQYIDHTLLKADATAEDIKNLCNEAIKYQFASVCLNPCYVQLAKKILTDSKIMVCTVIGFPLGANTSKMKALETKIAIEDGADEVDMVINIGALKNKDYELVTKDISEVVKAAGGKTVKVIFETSLLSNDEILQASKCALKANAQFIKTSTGFSTRGASLEDIKIMRDAVGELLQIKASGGIRDNKTALEYIQATVDRIGTSSGIQIVTTN